MSVLRKIWRALCSCNHRFEIRSFALLSTTLETFYLTHHIKTKFAIVHNFYI